jgi:hypothetical protein
MGRKMPTIEGFHRGYGSSPTLHPRLLRMREEHEDAVTAALAAGR